MTVNRVVGRSDLRRSPQSGNNPYHPAVWNGCHEGVVHNRDGAMKCYVFAEWRAQPSYEVIPIPYVNRIKKAYRLAVHIHLDAAFLLKQQHAQAIRDEGYALFFSDHVFDEGVLPVAFQ